MRTQFLALKLAFIVAAWSLALPATAQEPGDTPAQVEVAASAAADAESARRRAANLEILYEQIMNIETERGPYDARLIEILSDLGRLYQSEGLHQEALDATMRALQLVRISEGLYAERQLVLLEQLIASNQAMGNWERLDANHHLLFQLRKRSTGIDKSIYSRAVVDFGAWRLRALTDNLLGRSLSARMRELDNLQDMYADALEQHTDPLHAVTDTYSLLSLLEGKARIESVMANSLVRMPVDYFEGRGSRYLVRTVCLPGGSPNAQPLQTVDDSDAAGDEVVTDSRGQVVRVCTTERIENPSFRDSQRNEQRMRVDRANLMMRSTIQEMRSVLSIATDLNAQQRSQQEQSAQSLEQLYQELQRELRRNMFNWGLSR